jgi:RNA-directed DNA polymerase
MIREESKRKPHKDQSTDAEHRGGATRSSVENPVMGLEQRGCVVQLLTKEQPQKGRILLEKVKSFKKTAER